MSTDRGPDRACQWSGQHRTPLSRGMWCPWPCWVTTTAKKRSPGGVVSPLSPFWADFTPKQMRKAWSILAAGSASAKAAAPPAVVSAALTPCPQPSSHLHGDLQGCTTRGCRFFREKQLSPSGCYTAGAPRLGCGCPSPAVSVLCSHRGWPCLWLPPPHHSFALKCS